MAKNPDNSNIGSIIQQRYGIIGNSAAIQEVVRKLIQVAPTDLAVLITGETGTGKEIFAHAIHGLSNRKKFQFLSVNCGAIPETLLESELFGHERGAFTGAVEQRKGFFEVADKGTIFLDEIGDMPFGTQVKLLRVLESGEFSRLGSTAMKKVDVRVIAATNLDLESAIAEGRFRQDLFFRLKNFQIHLPPLRRHLEDLPVLVSYFAERISEKLGIRYDGISDDSMSILRNQPWPGNVRELRNLIETMITLEQATYITPDILRHYIAPALPPADRNPQPKDLSIVPISSSYEPKNLELELIFRTLLELKNDISDIKRFLINLNLKIDDVKEQFFTNTQFVGSADYEEVPSISDEELKIEDMEKKLIVMALRKHDGSRRQAAQSLGISERTLYRKITEFGINE